MKELAPRPWKLDYEIEAGGISYIIDATGHGVASLYDNTLHGKPVMDSQSNAELIVRAVNTHDQLVVALEEIMRLSSMVHLSVDAEDLLDSAYDIAKAALKSAKQ
jgi:hypothetical protein